MALLYYQNLERHRPDILMSRAFYGLKDFSDFLQQTEKHLNSDHAVKRLAWAAASRPEGDEDNALGAWISLEAPEDRPGEPEATFRAFLDEDAREVYEQGAPEGRRVEFRFGRQHSIRILDRDPAGQRLLLERQPTESQLLLRPNTNMLKRQLEAIACLQDTPSAEHRPLLRLLEANDHACWPAFAAPPLAVDAWKLLLDLERPGTDEQRRFVEQALHTTDFMLLEGPPGSGKTTAICELILQMAEQGKRVLLCASTHVAVDNVLEKLMDVRNEHRDQIIPIRIGDKRNVSEKAREWQLESFRTTERKRLQAALSRQRDLSRAQQTLLSALRQDEHVITQLVLSTANLTCGTTTGILQHPDLKNRRSNHPPYDMLILDEASKTTFQEFLVPAVLAKRWIIVGDPLQLSPYVDEQAMAANLNACLPQAWLRNACVDTFMARTRRRTSVIASPDKNARQAYKAQAEALGVNLAQAEDGTSLWDASIVLGASETLSARLDELPLDTTTVRGEAPVILERRAAAARQRNRQLRTAEPLPDWSAELAWRINAHYEQRQGSNDAGSEQTRKSQQIEQLMPVEGTGATLDHVQRNVERVRKVALPSILESLQEGFGRNAWEKAGNALSDGLPSDVMASRHIRLSHQHRMHPDIAAFSHHHIYKGQALFTPERMTTDRTWSYDRQAASWRHVKARFDAQSNSNTAEVDEVIAELKRFERWASKNRRMDGHPWEIAVLTYYRGQERALRKALRSWSGNGYAQRHFSKGTKGNPYITLDLCTVDRFQGHEADLVLLSLVRNHMTAFLQSPNRLNVALTRARYCRIIVGDRHRLGKYKDSLLSKLADEKNWETSLYDKH
ncbi:MULTISPECIES: AAA domain-containing protein [Pseudomonas]|uniref:AAA domain-containing protein n=1 Tax=Pseudomonas TaxID=286 RepID=UPI000691515F|nr:MULTISPECIES: AAA domain-containing protein [Pseudomonas]NWD09226.1 AAA family ATPase [Pseudomonas gingeri]NWE35051.1 AAA family ATPase [Pseudomonas gingeri]NWE61056.1 AAA family ATPase [Pseudomonas gingeri]NWF02673.1 AAA family ATPase [Pseudomonas gingeri]